MIWILVAMAAGALLYAFRAQIWAAVKKLAAKAGRWVRNKVASQPAPALAPKAAPKPPAAPAAPAAPEAPKPPASA